MVSKPGGGFFRQAPDSPVVARHINQYRRPAEAFERMSFTGIAQRTGPGGMPLIGQGITDLIVKAKAPSNGIPPKVGNVPGGPRDCTLYIWDGTSEILSSGKVAVRNSYLSAVGNDKDVWIVWRDGITWFVLTESC
jgi:hypothetical protein